MKKNILLIFLFAICISVFSRDLDSGAKTPSDNESVVIVNIILPEERTAFVDKNGDFYLSYRIKLNGKYLPDSKKLSQVIVVPNGFNNMELGVPLGFSIYESIAYRFECKSEKIYLEVICNNIDDPLKFGFKSITEIKREKLEFTESSSSDGTTLDNAVEGAVETICDSIPNGSKIAVLNMACFDEETSDFLIEEISYLLVKIGKFSVVDRKSLNAIRSEQDFQMSGEVSDESAINIGQFLGAEVVITGSLSGTGDMKRLRIKALDVKTGQIIAMGSERL